MKRADLGHAWRLVALAGIATGLALAPLAGSDPVDSRELAPLAGAALALAALRPRRPPPAPDSAGRRQLREGSGWIWLGVVALLAVACGLVVGSARVAAIDAGALQGPPGAAASLSGHLVSSPSFGPDGAEAELDTSAGRILLRGEGLGDLRVGEGVRARGVIEPLVEWRAATMARRGIALALAADRIEPTGEPRGGLAGRIDIVRDRAERALGRGMPEREAALARGFVLGQDDRIDARTREDFRRSGLSHLLGNPLIGQNGGQGEGPAPTGEGRPPRPPTRAGRALPGTLQPPQAGPGELSPRVPQPRGSRRRRRVARRRG